MTASAAYASWLRGGKPYRLMRPAKALQALLRAHGLTVYDYPNDAHLKASKPEDHTPFSATGWPLKSAVGVGHAVDVMPRNDTVAARRENAAIARTLIAARNAGRPEVAWIKYLNWTDENGNCRQESWKPNHVTASSTDKGHIHISGRSDCDDDPRADGYDPLSATPLTAGDDMGLGTEPLTQGNPGYAGHQHDTAWAFTWQAAAEAKENTDKLLAAAAADEVRDTAALAAINGLVAAVKAGGGSVDAAPIVAAVNAVRDEARTRFAELAAAVAKAEQRAAAAEAEVEQLRHAQHVAALAEADATADRP